MEHQMGSIDLNLIPQQWGTIWRFSLDPNRLPSFALGVRDEGGTLLALWGSDDRQFGRGFSIHVAFLCRVGLIWTTSSLDGNTPVYPDLASTFPQADRMQRATFDLLGIRADGAVDDRKWLRHGAWPRMVYPLRVDFDPATPPTSETDAYPFIRVEGDGVHEIPVGPIHAGTIEPGHFRFSIIGDRILKLEERLGYTHKGIEQRFRGIDLGLGAKLAGRVSGDSHIAYAWAYCMAVESATGSQVPERASWLRGLFLEMERVANHLGDLGYLGNDVALSFGFMQFWRLKENWLRLSAEVFGHRYLFDRIVPGGVASDIPEGGAGRLVELCDRIEAEVSDLKEIYDEHAGVQDRFTHTGIVQPELAARLGLVGLAGRASSQAWDLRVQFPHPPYDKLDVNMTLERQGDVQARAAVRFGEVFESLRLIRAILKQLPTGEILQPLPVPAAHCEGLGWVEGWRGPVIIAVRIGANGRLDYAHPHDPSWQNWPVMEVGVLGNIVPDFPLINKSFNLSYSGQDL